MQATWLFHEHMPSVAHKVDVFISHSSRDVHLAATLIDLLRAAVDLPHEGIRCTSVDGYRLPGGVPTEEQLKIEVRESRFFIALLTPQSLHSPYVLFELGARWGAQLNLVPLLGKGCSPTELKAPLSSLNALQCSSRAQLHQLLAEIADSLGVRLHPAATYQRALEQLLIANAMVAPEPIHLSQEVSGRVEADAHADPRTEAGKELLELVRQEMNLEKRGLVKIRSETRPGLTAYFPRIQYGGNPLAMKTRLFKEGIKELVELKWLFPPEESESTNTLTYEWNGPAESSPEIIVSLEATKFSPLQLKHALDRIRSEGEMILERWKSGDSSQHERCKSWFEGLEKFALSHFSVDQDSCLREFRTLSANDSFELFMAVPESIRADASMFADLQALAIRLDSLKELGNKIRD